MSKPINIDEARANVRAGAAKLDARTPAWYDDVDVPTLDMDGFTQCVLGQVYASYSFGLLTLGIDPNRDDSYGFALPVRCNHDDYDWDALRILWLIEIEDRRYAQLPGGDA